MNPLIFDSSIALTICNFGLPSLNIHQNFLPASVECVARNTASLTPDFAFCSHEPFLRKARAIKAASYSPIYHCHLRHFKDEVHRICDICLFSVWFSKYSGAWGECGKSMISSRDSVNFPHIKKRSNDTCGIPAMICHQPWNEFVLVKAYNAHK
ncbi:hypothetical protein C8F04DRAFT_1145995 [Mycena alexandri]|uniref:Uncharacterized protein n=1 Tax=Mycena alexandri TaxID=1745969 RepID=A0AAD6S335_9AGAR|nr:hypothetical protein C8F04DRAFT_1145995 [Mycena alexandri]